MQTNQVEQGYLRQKLHLHRNKPKQSYQYKTMDYKNTEEKKDHKVKSTKSFLHTLIDSSFLTFGCCISAANWQLSIRKVEMTLRQVGAACGRPCHRDWVNSAVMGKQQEVHSSAFIGFNSSLAASFPSVARNWIYLLVCTWGKRGTQLHSMACAQVCLCALPPMAD